MSLAIAAVGPNDMTTALEASAPLVLVEGVPEFDLQITRFSSALPTDAREASLSCISMSTDLIDRLHGKVITVARPYELSDGEIRWAVLLSGTIHRSELDLTSGLNRRTLDIQDRLLSLLGEAMDTAGPWPEAGLSFTAFIDRLAGSLQAELCFACDLDWAKALIVQPASQTETLGTALSRVLHSAGLRIQQTLKLEQDQVTRIITVMPAHAGRQVVLPWPGSDGRGGAILKVAHEAEQLPPRAWIATGARPVVEDTFDLVQGWDPALTGQPDTAYGRLTSADFSRFGSVYRAWVLNEDGAFTASPFEQGDGFDVGALFDAPGTITTPLRLGDCLVGDRSGRAIAPVIESSTDNGANWLAYPGQAEVMADRAGLLLTDDTLPTAILTAAKAGTLRLRVTASLVAPQRVQDRRWDGNPFAGSGPTRVLSLGDRFVWRRVATTSIHANSIASGELTADLADDRPALRAALQQAIANSPGPQAEATVDLAGAWTAFRPGDRVRGLLEPGLGIDALPTVFNGRPARIRRIQISFGVVGNAPRTRLTFD